jgi:hypothetical protein
MGREHFKRTLSAPGLATPGYEIRTASIALSIAQVKALRATPAVLVPAPGAGRALQLISGVIIYDYAAVYTETADNLVARYTNGSGAAASQVIEATGFLDATTDELRPILPANDADMVANAALVLHNNGDGELGGTGSPIRIFVQFAVITTGL